MGGEGCGFGTSADDQLDDGRAQVAMGDQSISS